MSRGNRAQGLTLDPTIGAVSNAMESTGNLAIRSSNWFKKQKEQITEVFRSNPENKRYKKIGNMPVAIANGALVPVNAALGIGHKGLQAVQALWRTGGNGVKRLQKTILGKDINYRTLVNPQSHNRLGKKLSDGLKIPYIGSKTASSEKPKEEEKKK